MKMITNLSYIRRQPLVSKPSQIYASTDRRQNLQHLNNNNRSTKLDTQVSPVASFNLYGNRYETKILQRTFDIKI